MCGLGWGGGLKLLGAWEFYTASWCHVEEAVWLNS